MNKIPVGERTRRIALAFLPTFFIPYFIFAMYQAMEHNNPYHLGIITFGCVGIATTGCVCLAIGCCYNLWRWALLDK